MSSPGRLCIAENGIAGEALEEAVLDHRPAAAQPFLGRLKDEVHGAVECPRLGEVARRAQQHGGMPVMAAGMHAAIVARAVGKAVGLLDWQRVHIGAQADAARRAAAAQDADDAGAADAAMHHAAEPRQPLGHQIRGAPLLEAELGMGVDVAAPLGQFVGEFADARDRRHQLAAFRARKYFFIGAK